jgi:hypothetical protein
MSCCGEQQDFCIGAGATFHPVIRWGTDVLVSKPITAITQAAPAAVTATAHGAPNGWQAAVVSALGMTQINAERYPPSGSDWQPITVIDANTVALNNVDSADYTAYLSGGFLVYSAPGLLAGMTATMTFWDNPAKTGTPLLTITPTLDFTAKTIAPLLATAGLTWALGYYNLDVTDSGGIITRILTGTLAIQ